MLRRAVAARPVQLADVGGVEVLDGHGTPAVVLEHLVFGAARAAAVDVRGPRGLLECGGVFADVGPPAVFPRPSLLANARSLIKAQKGMTKKGNEQEKKKEENIHIIQSTLPQTMHALPVIRANHHIAQRRAVLQDEHGISITAFGLVVAGGRRPVPLVHAAVQAAACRDGLDGREVGGAGGLGEGGLEVCVSCGCRGDGGHGEEGEGLHVEGHCGGW